MSGCLRSLDFVRMRRHEYSGEGCSGDDEERRERRRRPSRPAQPVRNLVDARRCARKKRGLWRDAWREWSILTFGLCGLEQVGE